jgi:hypothetical protein
MFTADMARKGDQKGLDRRIRDAVRSQDAGYRAAYLRIYIEDPWCGTIQYELERRGFVNIRVPDITLKGDVYFEWTDERS